MRTYRQRHKRKVNAASRDRVKRGRKAKSKGRAWSNRTKRKSGKAKGKEKMLAQRLLRQKRERGLRQHER